MTNIIDLSVIYVYYNCPTEIKDSILSLKKELAQCKSEIIIVNNNSPIPLPQEVTNKKFKIIINVKNEGYGKALNQGAAIARGKYLLLTNPDTIFLKNSIILMIKKMEKNPNIGILSPQLLDANNHTQMVGSGMPLLPQALFAFTFFNKIFPNNFLSNTYYLPKFDRKKESEIPVLCGACMMLKKSLFDKIGGFDEQFFMYFEEADLCYRIKKAGYKVLYYPIAQVIHYIGRSSNDKKFIRSVYEESRFKFFKKYHNSILAVIAEAFLRIVNNL